MNDLLEEADNGGYSHTSDRDEWETVATSGAGYDTVGPSVGLRTFYNSRSIKKAGSSIADVSDEDTTFPSNQELSGSQERILQHPPDDDGPHNYRLRNLKGAGRPVFVPEPRFHRVNGFMQNSTRFISDLNTTNSSFVRNVSNPFRNIASKRKVNESHFPPNKNGGNSKFEFRDSADIASFGEHLAQNKHFQSCQNDTDHRDGHHSASDSSQNTSPAGSQYNQEGKNEESGLTLESGQTDHKLPFVLLPLPEAARRQALRRASGEDDQTETGTARARRAGSYTPSFKTARGFSSPSSQLIPPLPETVHRRAPTAFYTPSSPEYPTGHWGGNRFIVAEEGGRRLFRPRKNANQLIHPTSTINTTMTSVASPRVYRGRDPALEPPHLYAWDERPHAVSTDPSLRALAYDVDVEAARAARYGDVHVSDEAYKKRTCWFIIMVILSIFPFIAVLIERGRFNDALSWCTHGEIHRLTTTQKKIIRGIIILELIAYPSLIVIAIWRIMVMQGSS